MTDEYGPSTYGDRIARVYDDWYGLPSDADQLVGALAALAGEGPVLELGIGTGRVALLLAERGLEVHGIDASEEMVAQLREKPGGDRIAVTIGDFADVAVERRFSLVFVVFNTFFCLLSQDDQARCFANVAERLADGGVFVLEAFMPDVARFDRGQRVHAERADPDLAQFHVALHDPVTQIVQSQHVLVREDGIRLYPVTIRYAWPAELDLMAKLAGMRLRGRWAGWNGERFDWDSGKHVSVYERG